MDQAFATDCMVHVAMLFTVLTLFFKMFISKVETAAFRSNFQQLVDKNVGDNPNVKKVMGTVVGKRIAKSKNIQALRDLYNKPDDGVQQNNKWLFRTAFTGAAGLIAVTLAIVLAANGTVPFPSILKHNLITFAFVGVVEYVFFTQVAMKYEPAPPSFLITSALQAAKDSVS